jgi:molybdate transport system ATP-binding protein
MTILARFALDRGGFRLDAAFEAPGQGVTALFGQSGSGKTTVLRCMAGLERAPGGYFCVNGEDWQDEARGIFLAPHRRPLGYVFQDARLFPHLSVRANLEYGWSRTPRPQRRLQIDEVIALLGLDPLLARVPANLSGGEQQRVAIGRALLTSPALLMMDEPLASLDTASKAEILPFLERLHAELAMPIVYVSHALDEVLRLADHLVLIEAGRIRAQGAMTELIARADLPFAHLDDAGSVLDAIIADHDEAFHLTRLRFAGGFITAARLDLPVGKTVRVRVLARDVSLTLDAPERTSIQNIFPARVADIAAHNPSQASVRLVVDGATLLARITHKSVAQLHLQVGTSVFAQVKSVALMP